MRRADFAILAMMFDKSAKRKHLLMVVAILAVAVVVSVMVVVSLSALV